ncbi:MAG: D-alanine--D-alanine ligase family protein [Anaerolineaceae bacterium]
MAKQRVAVIFGGRSGEHEVSVVSARSVFNALDRERWEPVPIAITRRGAWLGSTESREAIQSNRASFDGEIGDSILRSRDALAALASCDVAFPLVHGTYGEDGTLQGFLEIAGMPYAGCGVAASAIGMDKALMKALFKESGIPVTRYLVIRSWEYTLTQKLSMELIEESIGYPCFVKPANGGSSVGITRADSREDIAAAIELALSYDDKVVVEQPVHGREVECAVLGNEDPKASIVGEIEPDRAFYDYESKYSATSTTGLHIPARIDAATTAKVQELAIRMYQVMGCEGYARVDFFATDGGDVVANEINTIPGFTSISMYPKLWEASGVAYPELLTRILELALERHERRARR